MPTMNPLDQAKLCASSFCCGLDLGQVPFLEKTQKEDGKWIMKIWFAVTHFEVECLSEDEAKVLCQMWVYARSSGKKVILRIDDDGGNQIDVF